MGYLKDLGLSMVTLKNAWLHLSLLSLITGLSFRETKRCEAFQESLITDTTAMRHIDQLDLAEVDNFISQLVNCKGCLYISGIGE